ncbi:MAG: AsmA family protein [bacterium]|nr:AsmA family protein [bacterium]
MNKLVKYSLIGGGILILLLVAGLIAAPYLLNVDALREYGERQATGRLGRQVTIEKAGFSWAGPKIKLSGFSIAEADGFGDEPFARFDSFDLKLRLTDLFRLRLSVEYVVLSGPKIRIVRTKEGRFNFDDILDSLNRSTATAGIPQHPKALAAPLAAPYAAMDPGAQAVKAPPIDLLVDEIRMEQGEVFFADATNPRLARGISLKEMTLSLRDLSFDRPITISAALGIGRMGEDVRFEGTVGPVGRQIVPGRIPVDLSLTILPFELARIPEIAGPLPVGVSGVVSATEKISGSLSTGIVFELTASLQDLNVARKDGVPLVTGFEGSIVEKGRVDLGKKLLTLESFSLKAYQAVFDASGTVRNPGSQPTVDLAVRSNAIPLSGWDAVLPDLGPMVKLDGDLTFEGKVTGTVGKDLAADLTFVSRKFEVDRGPALLERSSSAPPIAAPAAAKGLEPIQPLPVTVTGTVTVQQGRFEKISFSDMSAALSMKGTRFALDGMKLSAFSGLLAGAAWADLGALPLAYGSNMKMTGVEVNDALAAVAGMDGVLYGKASMDVAIEGKGTEFADLEKYLSGRGAVKAADGRLTTANLGGGAAKAASLLGLDDSKGETRFEDMDVSFTIEDGKIKVSNMRIATAEYTMRIQGDIGLDKSLAMTSRMTLSQESTAKVPADRRKLFPKETDGRLQIPLKIGGTVTSPKVGLDSSAMNQAAKEEMKQEVEEKKEELKKDLGKKLRKLFQ